MKEKRYFGLDCVRVLALCLLLWLHFLLRNGFYSRKVDNWPMVAAAAGRIVFMCCIPLFLMLTGYLKCTKPWKKGYYHSLLPILISWVIVSFLCLAYKIFVLGQQKTGYQWLADFLNFDTANYSWYIEMYIGLLMLSPFLNAAWEKLGTKKQRTCMILSFVLLTFVPTTVNKFKLDGETVLNLIPNYWTSLWFLTYYLIGCYIRTYQPKVRWQLSVLAAIAIAFAFAVINRYTGGAAKNFSNGYTMTYGHLGTAAISVLLFLSVYRAECRQPVICRIMQAISGVSLEMYLVSCLFDQKIYPYQKGKYGAEEYWWRGLLACGLVFILSFLLGWAVHYISAKSAKGIRWGLEKLRK